MNNCYEVATENNVSPQTYPRRRVSQKNFAVVMDQMAACIGGAESVLFAILDMYPDVSIYTTVYNRDIFPEQYKDIKIKASIIQDLPFSKKLYKAYLPLMPFAIEHLDMQEYDLILSSHHCVSKGVIPRPDAIHICYCHSPARYLWDLFWTYSRLNRFSPLKVIVTSMISHYMRIWDVCCSSRIDYFLANSTYTAHRIKKFYNRNSEILYPPVDTGKFSYESTGDYYLMAGRLVAYKGYELAIEAFNESGKKLVIIGDGPEYQKLKNKIKPNITMLGRTSEEVLIKHMNNCKGFIFPGKEDFGIVMAEAQAAGKPVIAYKAGGALDIVIHGETGVLFNEQSTSSLNRAIYEAESRSWNHHFIREHSLMFDKKVFQRKLHYILEHASSFQSKDFGQILSSTNQFKVML